MLPQIEGHDHNSMRLHLFVFGYWMEMLLGIFIANPHALDHYMLLYYRRS